MRIIISEIPEEGIEQSFDLPVAIQENALADRVSVSIRAFRYGKKVLVEGSLRVAASLKCSRCLRDFTYPIETEFRDEYSPAGSGGKEQEQQLTAGELDLSYYADDELDVDALVGEQVLLSVPMKPLCRPDCTGLCPHCGKDLNEQPCTCEVMDIDPRLAPLGKLKDAMKDHRTS